MGPNQSSESPCRQCGYSLRGLDAQGNCPECGLPIRESTIVERMADAPRDWVITQRIGIWILFACYAMAALAILGEVYRSYTSTIPRWAYASLHTTPLLLLALSVWLLTIQRRDRQAKASSLLVRWGFVAVLGLSLMLPFVQHSGLDSVWGRVGWTLFFVLLVVCWIGLGCIQIRIARMLGAAWLSPVIWSASVLWSIALLLAAAFYLPREYVGRTLFSRAETVFVATLLFGGILLVLSSLLVAVNFRRVRMSPSPQ